jgi:hypothetical protein
MSRSLLRFVAPSCALLLTLVSADIAAAQANDDCSAATPILSLPFTVSSLDTTAATTGGGDPFPSCGVSNNNNVWYSFTAARDTSLEIDTGASDYDTVVTVYTGTCATLVETGCNDNTPSDSTSKVIMPLDEGDSVLISVSSRFAGGGTLTLSADESSPRYLKPVSLSEAVLSSDASPLGGSYGSITSAMALDGKTIGFTASTGGVFLRSGGVLTTIAASGDPTPAGGTFRTFGNPSVNGAGIVVFRATFDNGGAVSDGIFQYSGGVITSLFLENGASPDGGTYRIFRNDTVINDAGNVAFVARTTAGGARDRIFVFDGVVTTLMATEGVPCPCGGTINRIALGTPRGWDLSDTGINIVFFADAGGIGSHDGIFTSNGVSLTTIACHGAATPLGGTHSDVGDQPTLNSLGQVYFVSRISGGPVSSALWRYVGGITTAIAQPGTALATGGSITDLRADQTVATNAAGDVAFSAAVTGSARSVLFKTLAAALPSEVVGQADACPAGGTFESVDDELDLAPNGDIAFEASCTGDHGTFFVPLAGAVASHGLVADATAIGTGFRFLDPAVNGAAQSAFRGSRSGAYSVTCSHGVCAPPALALVAGGDAIPGPSGQHIDTILSETFNGVRDEQAFIAILAGTSFVDAVVRVEKGVLDVVAATGDTTPDGAGTYASFPTADDLSGELSQPSTARGVVAFFAALDHPTASSGIFARTKQGTFAIALDNDPAPDGDFFYIFGAPIVRKKSVVFVAQTGLNTCLFGVKRVGQPVTMLACENDPLPAPIVFLSSFLGTPSGTSTDAYFPADAAGGSVDACVFRTRKGVTSPFVCVDDPLVYGAFADDILGQTTNTGPVAESKGKGLLFVANGGLNSEDILIAVRKNVRYPMFVNAVSVGPVTGGTYNFNSFAPASMSKKTVALAVDITAGTVGSAVLVGELK